jgi:plastocyanin domain-containing protein
MSTVKKSVRPGVFGRIKKWNETRKNNKTQKRLQKENKKEIIFFMDGGCWKNIIL